MFFQGLIPIDNRTNSYNNKRAPPPPSLKQQDKTAGEYGNEI